MTLNTPDTALSAADHLAIQEVVLRYFHALDTHDWTLCRSCFGDTVVMDYTDLRGDAATIDADSFVEKRRVALSALRTLHQNTNHRVTLDGDAAVCTSNAVIYRWAQDDSFHTYALYTHRLARAGSGWQITGVKQTVVANTGNPDLHQGAKR